MSLLNMTICTHLLIILVTLGNITFIRSYHISVEPQPTLKYNGHIVSSKIWLFVSIWLLLVFGFTDSIYPTAISLFRFSVSPTILITINYKRSINYYRKLNTSRNVESIRLNRIAWFISTFPFFLFRLSQFLIHEFYRWRFHFNRNFFLLRSVFSSLALPLFHLDTMRQLPIHPLHIYSHPIPNHLEC